MSVSLEEERPLYYHQQVGEGTSPKDGRMGHLFIPKGFKGTERLKNVGSINLMSNWAGPHSFSTWALILVQWTCQILWGSDTFLLKSCTLSIVSHTLLQCKMKSSFYVTKEAF